MRPAASVEDSTAAAGRKPGLGRPLQDVLRIETEKDRQTLAPPRSTWGTDAQPLCLRRLLLLPAQWSLGAAPHQILTIQKPSSLPQLAKTWGVMWVVANTNAAIFGNSGLSATALQRSPVLHQCPPPASHQPAAVQQKESRF